MFKYTDKVLQQLNRRLLRLFRRLHLIKLDELNIVNEVSSVYKTVERQAKKAYLDIAVHAYLYAFKDADENEVPLDSKWIQNILDEADEVTLYKFSTEIERKKQRLIEALAVTKFPDSEIDKALKYLSRQLAHYADKITVDAVIEGFKDSGVEKVMWVTEKDERVCNVCRPRDGKIFGIDKVPQIPAHWNCRCVLVKV